MHKYMKMLGAIVALALSTVATAASATTFVYSFSADNGAAGAFGTLEATDNGNGSFTATSGTITTFGTIAMGSGTLIPNPNAPAPSTTPTMNGFFIIYDDLLFPGQNPLVNINGLAFNINGTNINIYSPNGPSSYAVFDNGSTAVTPGNFSLSQVAAVPEPATWAMMIVGFGMIGAGIRSRKRQTVRVAYA
ncbi:MAG: PEPxxWA-CTERM sorting domain-containing protein [Sphingomonas sp.]|nr:PEPxxWA-CTERM sorting domain-containing protein [Sphingomonas sp.]